MSSVPLPQRRAVGDVGWQPTVTIVAAPRTRPAIRQPPRTALLVAAPAAALVVSATTLGVGAVSLARSLEGRVLPGVVVAGTDLSGLPLERAAARVTAAADAVLDAPLVLDAAGTTTTLTPRMLGAQANTDAVVRLLQADRAGVGPWGWVRLRWFGGQAPPAPALHVATADTSTVETTIAGLAEGLERDAVDAGWSHDDDAITFTSHVDEVRVDVAATAAVVADAVAALVADGGPPTDAPAVQAVVVVTPAATALAQLGQVLFLDQSTHTLQLHEDGQLRGEWVVATGAAGFPTPTGEYTVAEKRENPTWGNPAPDHIRFHGTNQEWTLGTDASHGCVRMANDDVVELFDLVHTGTPIISVR